MEYQDYYKTLGVARSAGADEIKRAYRKLAHRYHPDVSKEPDAQARMQEINEAWAVLSDPEKRAAYDQLGSNFQSGQNFRPPPGWGSGFEFSSRGGGLGSGGADYSDFFSSLFGSMGGDPHQFRHAPRAGEDKQARISIDIEDTYAGNTKTITLQSPEQDDYGRVMMKTRQIQVKIPKGICEGQKIRLAGQGGASPSGGRSGDLLLIVQFNQGRHLRVDERDVYQTVPVAPWELALGTTVSVRVPDGEVEVRIPQGSQNGRKLRLKSRGIPGKPAGDLYLELEVVLPPADSEQAKEIYRTMERVMAFRPRG